MSLDTCMSFHWKINILIKNDKVTKELKKETYKD